MMRNFALILIFCGALVGCETTSVETQHDKPETRAQAGAPMTAKMETIEGPVYELAELDEPPKAIARSAPELPKHILDRRLNGTVTCSFVILKDGTTSNLIIEEATYEAHAAAVLDSISTWRFQPAVKDGQPVNCRARIRMPFVSR